MMYKVAVLASCTGAFQYAEGPQKAREVGGEVGSY